MPVRTIASFAIAIFLGLVAVFLVRNYLAGAQPNGQVASSQRAVAGSTPVVVAAIPIARGATLDPTLLKVVNYPAGSVPAGAFTAVNQISGTGAAARVSLRAMLPDEPLLSSRVSAPGAKGNLSGVLMPGKRAISVKSSDVAGVGGFVLPGDRVDVLVTRQVSPESSVTQVLAENVRVLGVDQTDDQDADKPVVAKAVTVEVSPDEASAISLAQSIGTVALSLRQYGDEAPLTRRSMSIAELGGVRAPIAAAVMRPVANKPKAPAPAPVEQKAPAPVNTAEVRITRGVETEQYTVGR